VETQEACFVCPKCAWCVPCEECDCNAKSIDASDFDRKFLSGRVKIVQKPQRKLSSVRLPN
jgi:hypothetical protein